MTEYFREVVKIDGHDATIRITDEFGILSVMAEQYYLFSLNENGKLLLHPGVNLPYIKTNKAGEIKLRKTLCTLGMCQGRKDVKIDGIDFTIIYDDLSGIAIKDKATGDYLFALTSEGKLRRINSISSSIPYLKLDKKRRIKLQK